MRDEKEERSKQDQTKQGKATQHTHACTMYISLRGTCRVQFALCARKVKNRPMVNEVFGGEEALQKKLKQFERENEELRRKLGSVSWPHPPRHTSL